MPKDAARNQPNYKIGGDHLNEYEFQQHHDEISKEQDDRFARREEERRVREAEARHQTDDKHGELEAEQESAAAMDADVPQPPEAAETTEGQPT